MPDDPRSICSCGKIAYPDQATAKRVARMLERRTPKPSGRRTRQRNPASGREMNAYACLLVVNGRTSGAWHVGHAKRTDA